MNTVIEKHSVTLNPQFVSKALGVVIKCTGGEEKGVKDFFKDILISFYEEKNYGTFTTTNGKDLMIVGFPLEESVDFSLNARIDGSQFKNLLNVFSKEQLKINIDEKKLEVKTKESRLKISLKEKEEFYDFIKSIMLTPEEKIEIATTSGEELLELFNEVYTLVEHDGKGGFPILLEFSDKNLSAYSLSILKESVSKSDIELSEGKEKGQFKMYVDSVKILLNLLKATKNHIYKIYTNKERDRLEFKSQAAIFTCYLYSEKIPDMSAVMKMIMKEPKIEIRVKKQLMQEALKKIEIIKGKDDILPVMINVEKDNMIIEASTPYGEIKEKVPIENSNTEELKTIFAFKVLTKNLNTIATNHNDEYIKVYLTDKFQGSKKYIAVLQTEEKPQHICIFIGLEN